MYSDLRCTFPAKISGVRKNWGATWNRIQNRSDNNGVDWTEIYVIEYYFEK